MEQNFQGLKISRVKKRTTSYRLHFNDNSILDLPYDEIGDFIPKHGMYVKLKLYKSLVLKEFQADGVIILNRSFAKLVSLLKELQDKLEEDLQREIDFSSMDTAELIKLMPGCFVHRYNMLKLNKHLKEDALYKEFCCYETAINISEGETPKESKDVTTAMIAYASVLAEAYEAETKNIYGEEDDFINSPVLNVKMTASGKEIEPEKEIRTYLASFEP